MILCYLGLGSNLNSPQRQLRKALEALRHLPESNISKVAGFYRSKAWGRKGMPNFCNTVVALNTRLDPFRLLRLCQDIELKQGRVRKVRYGARTLDIDILLFGSQKIKRLRLTVPHPRLHERDFVLIPLLEISKDQGVIALKSIDKPKKSS